jgi:hypothetical protein
MKNNKYLVLLFVIVFFTVINSCKKKDEPLPAYDDRVVPYKIIDETFRIGSTSSLVGNDCKVIRSITLPHRALYWCYWFGIDEDPVKALASVAIPAAAAGYTDDPFIAYGWGFLSYLNASQIGNGNVDLYFCDGINKTRFENDDPNYTPFPFFQCPQAITSYAIRETLEPPSLHDSTFYVTFRNHHPLKGYDVTLKVWAYVIKE